METKTSTVMNTRYVRKQTCVPLYRKTKSLFNWLAKVTGVEACWIEGVNEHNRPVWGLIKRITANRFLVRSSRLAAASMLGASLCLLSPSANAQTPIEASTFRGQNGFTVTGVEYGDNLGGALAIGDINGDGFNDLITGAFGAGAYGSNNSPGQTAVVFGTSSGFDSSISLTSLDGVNGFVLNGPNEGAQASFSVASGDVNGDGIDDIIIGAPGINPVSAVYVVFGKTAAFSSSVELSSIADGTNGFLLVGETDGDGTGISVGAADINGDHLTDIFVGSDQADPNGITNAGQAFVVFGQTGAFADTLQLTSLQGNDSGFVILGNEDRGALGNGFASGDINGDGFEDLVIGAPDRYGSGYYIFYGDVYVVFGQSDAFADTLNISNLDGSNGFRFRGTAPNNYFGSAIGSGDVNGDGYDDLFVNADGYGRNYQQDYKGEVYVLFGKSTSFPSVIDDSSVINSGTSGFFFEGVNNKDYMGENFASVDLNGDGMDELITGSAYAYSGSGAVYIIFGFDDTSVSQFQLSSLDGDNGFVIKGDNGIGDTIKAGDLDGDGFDEIISGKGSTNIPSTERAGVTTIFFNTINQIITGNEGFRMLSAPTHGPVFDELLNPFFTQGFAGSDTNSVVVDDNVWTWDTGSQAWTALTNQATDSLDAGQGFLFYIFSDDDPDSAGDDGFPKRISASQFGGDGSLNAGTIAAVSGLGDGDFFLAGNPFASTIDWDSSAVSKTNLSGPIYIWDDANSQYQTWNGTTGNANEGEIAPFQGFFIEAFGGTGSLSIGDGAISDSAGVFLKQVQAEPKILKIQAEAGDFEANAWLSFQQGGQTSRDAYDALALQPLSDAWLRLATVTDNQQELTINALPPDQADQLRVPLLISGLAVDTETAHLSFEGLDDFTGWSIAIHDRDTEQVMEVTGEHEIRLPIEQVQAKQVAQPGLPAPAIVKAKTDAHRFQLVLTPGTSVNTEPVSELPTVVELQQNYPNPFNPATTIEYGVPNAGPVTLEVFDIMGRKVATLVKRETMQPGRYQVRFDASQLASGMYLYRLAAGNTVLTKKLTLIK